MRWKEVFSKPYRGYLECSTNRFSIALDNAERDEEAATSDDESNNERDDGTDEDRQDDDESDFESDIDDPAVWIKRKPHDTRVADADTYAGTFDGTPDNDAKKAARVEHLEEWEAVLKFRLTETRSELKKLRG